MVLYHYPAVCSPARCQLVRRIETDAGMKYQTFFSCCCAGLLSIASLALAAHTAGAQEREPAGQGAAAGNGQSILAASLAELQYACAVLGYVYAAPVFESAAAEYRQVAGPASQLSGARGTFAHSGQLADHETSWLDAPSPDVLYSSAWLQLKNRPYVIYVPPMDDVWYSLRFADYFMNDAGYLSSRSVGSSGGSYLIVYRDWSGPLPWGVRDVIKVPTPGARILMRIAATRQNAADVITRYQRRFRLIPLDEYLKSPRRAKDFQPRAQAGLPPPVRALDEMRGQLEYFQVVNHLLHGMELPQQDEGLIRLLDIAGLGPAQPLDLAKMPAPSLQALIRAAAAGARIMRDMRYQPRSSEQSLAPPGSGAYGNYLLRAIAAYGGAGADMPAETLQRNAYYDSTGRLLDGRYDYRVTFHRGGYPPAGAFWSLTAYSAQTRLLMENSQQRYGIGSTTENLQYGEDGSLRLLLSSREPREPKLRANWLPLGAKPFFIMERIYMPLPSALKGSYLLPPLERVEQVRTEEEEEEPLF